ncbi:unnamed protein product [Fusarium graminearum]|nr:unnamed protein product [Fusarium graminearum]
MTTLHVTQQIQSPWLVVSRFRARPVHPPPSKGSARRPGCVDKHSTAQHSTAPHKRLGSRLKRRLYFGLHNQEVKPHGYNPTLSAFCYRPYVDVS